MTRFFTLIIFLCCVFSLEGATITGVVTYDKLIYGSSSSTTTSEPLVGAQITAFFSGSSLGSVKTTAGGSYSIDIGTASSYILTVSAKSDFFTIGSGLSGSNATGVYSYSTSSSSLTSQNVHISRSNSSGAFNILHQLERGRTWFLNFGHSFSRSTSVLWPSSEGSFYEPTANVMHILSNSSGLGDIDEFDDDIILHEFGHIAIEDLSKDHSLGGGHSLNGQYDLRLAWSEGVATYLSSAIRNSSINIDFTGSFPPSGVDIAQPNSSQKQSTNEVAVANVLWNATQQDGSAQKVLTGITSFKNLPSTLTGDQISLDTFIDLYSGSDLSSFITDRNMSYRSDGLSGGNHQLTAVILTSNLTGLTFYPSKASDWFLVTGNVGASVTMTTKNTGNGALTYLRFYDSQMTLLQSNDQANGLSTDTTSTINHVLASSGNYYLEVGRYISSTKNYGIDGSIGQGPTAYSSTVGRYGNYDLDFSVIESLNSAPIITEGATKSVLMSEDSPPTAFTLNATDADASDTLTWSILSVASHGTASVSGTPTGSSQVISFTPTTHYYGTDSFVVSVSDGLVSDLITINVTITAINDAPIITEGTTKSVSMSEDSTPTAFALTLNATDADASDTLIWSVSSVASHGTASVSGTPTGTSQVISFTPTANYSGSDSFSLQVFDGTDSDRILVSVTILTVSTVLPGDSNGNGNVDDLSAPSVTSASIVETVLKKGSVATLSVVSSTSPAPTSLAYQWLVDGGSIAGAISSTIDLSSQSSVSKGKSLSCQVTPLSGNASYDVVTTSAVLISNTAPGGNVMVFVSPLHPTAGQSIVASAGGASDVDGDTVSFTYSWAKNGIAQNISTAQVSAVLVVKGDTWTVTATPSDGTETGGSVTSSVSVGSAPPVVSSISLSGNTGFATTEISVTIHATDLEDDIVSYSFDTNGDGKVDHTQSTNVYSTTFVKGTYKVYGLATDSTGKDSPLASSSDNLVIVNSVPLVSAGVDRSGGTNITVKNLAVVSDPDVKDSLAYRWAQISGNAVTFVSGSSNVHSAVLEFTPADKGMYTFELTVNDGYVVVSDSIIFTIDDLFKVVTSGNRTIPPSASITAVENVSITTEAHVTSALENAYALSQSNLDTATRTNALGAIEKVFGSSATIVLDDTQISQSLGSLDNLIGSASANLTDADTKSVSVAVGKLFERGVVLNDSNIAKTYEVLDKVLGQHTLSGNQKQLSLSSEIQQSMGTAIMSTVSGTTKNLIAGGSSNIDQNNLRIRAQAFFSVTSEVVVGDNTQGYQIKLPANPDLTSIVVSAAKMAINPHLGKVAAGEKEPVGEVVSFNINTLGTTSKFSFSNVLTLTIPAPASSGLSSGNTFSPRFFDEVNFVWSSKGITNISHDKDLNQVTFNVTHLTDFSVVDEPISSNTSPFSGGGGGGGCLLK